MSLALIVHSGGVWAKEAAAPPSIAFIQAAPGNIFSPGATMAIGVAVKADISWRLTDYDDRLVQSAAAHYTGAAAIPLAFGALPVGLYTLAVVSTGAHGGQSGGTTLAVTPPSAHANPQFGVNSHLGLVAWYPDIVALITRGGFGAIRDVPQWVGVEHVRTTPPTYAWHADFDQYMAGLAAAGTAPLLTLAFGSPLYDNTGGAKPQWATPHTSSGLAGYANYSAAVVRHYPQAHEFAVWNEFNGSFCRPGPGANRVCTAAGYTRLLATAYAAIKRADPTAIVVGGAEVPLAHDHGTFNDAGVWYRSLIAEGAFTSCSGPCLDAIDIHPYTNAAVGAPEDNEGAADHLRAVIAGLTGRTFPIYATEFSDFNHDPKHQAGYAVKEATILLAQNIAKLYWYLLHDEAASTYEGLMYGQGRTQWPAPAYLAYSQLARVLDGARYVGREDDGSTYRVYVFAGPAGAIRVGWTIGGAVIAHRLPGTVTDVIGRPAAGAVLTDSPLISLS